MLPYPIGTHGEVPRGRGRGQGGRVTCTCGTSSTFGNIEIECQIQCRDRSWWRGIYIPQFPVHPCTEGTPPTPNFPSPHPHNLFFSWGKHSSRMQINTLMYIQYLHAMHAALLATCVNIAGVKYTHFLHNAMRLWVHVHVLHFIPHLAIFELQSKYLLGAPHKRLQCIFGHVQFQQATGIQSWLIIAVAMHGMKTAQPLCLKKASIAHFVLLGTCSNLVPSLGGWKDF